MEPKVSSVNHVALVNNYYMGSMCVREDSLQIPSAAFFRPPTMNVSVEMSAAATRRQRKRETAARRRNRQLQELRTQGKFVPLNERVRNALQHAYKRLGGPRFVLRDFLPIFDEGHGDAVNSLTEKLSSEMLDDGNVHRNQSDRLHVAVVNGIKVVIPADVSRGKHYDTFDHTELLKIDIAHIADPDGCILAVWVTHRPRYLTYLREQALPLWGFTFHACWYWLKLSRNGELVTPLDSTHRLPIETLVVAYRAKDRVCEQLLRQRLGDDMRIVLSIPLRHSWKPPPESFFDEDTVPVTNRKAELFARELRPNWTSVGNEVRLRSLVFPRSLINDMYSLARFLSFRKQICFM
ncbi:Methyltransferase [Phytophthora megakarya]|uniref:Methyltransferase n=1 Tax=Phytophthora megakarya TaxID=4795 RepID=A0A225WNJ9_9STRA|nr:Methyltransferase [Phytophthora megakarya]